MIIKAFGDQLKYIKVGIVMTVIEDISTYPDNTAGFSYSGVYMDYALYNVDQPVSWAPSSQPGNPQPGSRAAGEQNYNFFPILNAKYQIIGLSSFAITTLPSTVTVVNYELSFPDIATVLLQTDDVNELEQVKISADFWNSQITGCNPTTTDMYNIQQKLLVSSPPLKVGEQNIIETSSLLNFDYIVAADDDPANPLSSSVAFTNSLYFENFVAGRSYKIDFIIKTGPSSAGLMPDIGTQFDYTVSVEGNQIVSKNYVTTSNLV